MSISEGEIYKTVCKFLEPLNSQGLELSGATDISADLKIDSVTVMDFVMEIEDEFDIDIPLNVLSETRNIDDLVKVVQVQMKNGQS